MMTGLQAYERSVALGNDERMADAHERGRRSVLARLENPDEAMVETMASVARRLHDDLRFNLVDACRTLAAALEEQR